MKRKHGETKQHCWCKSPQEEMGGSHGPVGWALDQELHGLVSSSGATSMCYFWKVITSHRNFVSLSENCREWIKWSLRIFLAPDLVPFSLEASRVCCCFFLPVTCESLLCFPGPSLPSSWGFLTFHSCPALFSITPGHSSRQEPETNQYLIKINLCLELEQMFSQLGNETLCRSRSASIWGLRLLL